VSGREVCVRTQRRTDRVHPAFRQVFQPKLRDLAPKLRDLRRDLRHGDDVVTVRGHDNHGALAKS
jgi:hypothetical protein